MANDPARAEDTRAWLAKGREDLQAARRLLSPPRRLSNSALFHCQRAVEKALKGFLAWHDVPFRKTHNLLEIGSACVAIDPTLQEVIDLAAPLTEYAWKFRYPGEIPAASGREAISALALATKVFKTVLSRLPAKAKI